MHGTTTDTPKKRSKRKERHPSVMAARETNTIPARYLGKVGRQVSEEDENEEPALLYTIVLPGCLSMVR